MEEGLKAIPLARFLWLGMGSGEETNMITEMQQLLLKIHPQLHIHAERLRRCLSVTCSIQALLAARTALLPAAQPVLSLGAIFGSWVHLILPTPALVRRAQTLLSTPPPPLPAPSPLLRGLRTLFPGPSHFLGKRFSIQSFMWEASCWHPEYMSQICPASLSDPSAKELQVSNLLMGDEVPVSSAWSLLQMGCF